MALISCHNHVLLLHFFKGCLNLFLSADFLMSPHISAGIMSLVSNALCSELILQCFIKLQWYGFIILPKYLALFKFFSFCMILHTSN